MKRVVLVFAILLALAACGENASLAGGGAAPASNVSKQGGGTSSLAQQPAGGGVPALSQPADGSKVIRTGRITVEVPNGKFESKLSDLEDLMTGLGGFVAGSDAASDSGALRTGSVTFQVPSEHFQAALDGARNLGKVQAYVVSGQDVSSQYVDLSARLANEEAVRDAILQFFKDAHSVQDDITIENQLGQVTSQIEQLKGQIDYLDHATAYSTVSVTLREATAAAASALADNWGFTSALSQAAHNFVYVIDGMLEVAGSLLPFLVLLVPLWFALRHRRRLARIFAL